MLMDIEDAVKEESGILHDGNLVLNLDHLVLVFKEEEVEECHLVAI